MGLHGDVVTSHNTIPHVQLGAASTDRFIAHPRSMQPTTHLVVHRHAERLGCALRRTTATVAVVSVV